MSQFRIRHFPGFVNFKCITVYEVLNVFIESEILISHHNGYKYSLGTFLLPKFFFYWFFFYKKEILLKRDYSMQNGIK